MILWFHGPLAPVSYTHLENTDCFVLINAKDNRSLGEYYLNDSGPVSYTHLDVYKRQMINTAGGCRFTSA